MSPALLLAAHEAHDVAFRFLVGVADLDMHQEAVELRLRQGIGALLLDRILGRHHHEQRGQGMGFVADGDNPLLHRLQQRRLHFGRRAVDLVGQHQVGEDRAGLELERPLPALGEIDFRPGDVGRQKIGRELDAREVGLQVMSQAFDRPRLRQTRQPLDQQIAVGEQAEDQPVDHRLLADDAAADAGFQRKDRVARAHRATADSIAPWSSRRPP
jgi:hypothetical protein